MPPVERHGSVFFVILILVAVLAIAVAPARSHYGTDDHNPGDGEEGGFDGAMFDNAAAARHERVLSERDWDAADPIPLQEADFEPTDFETFDWTRVVTAAQDTGRVQRVKWDPAVPFIREVTNLAFPVVISNTVVETWPARRRWTPEYIAAVAPTLPFVEQTTERVIKYFDQGRPMVKTPSLQESFLEFVRLKENGTANMATSDLFDSLFDAEADVINYYMGELHRIGLPLSDVEPLAPLFADYLGAHDSEESLPLIYVWIGGHEAEAHLHYDTSFNTYTQLVGTKRWILSPPENQAFYYLYPRLHPGSRQSQVNVSDVEWERFPRWQAPDTITIDIQAGDTLYLPPYWFHRVIAMEPSVSINLWSNSESHQRYEKAHASPIPFANDWDVETVALALFFFAELVVAGSGGGAADTPLGDVLNALWTLRYKPIFDESASTGDWPFCGMRLPDWIANRANDARASSSDSQIGRHVLRGADGVVPLFRSEPRFAIRSTILQDYIEEVVFYLYGADRAPDMIRCLGCRGSDCQR